MPNFGVHSLFIEIKRNSSLISSVDKNRRFEYIYRVFRQISDLWQITQKCPISAFIGYSSRSSGIRGLFLALTKIVVLSLYIEFTVKFLISGKSPRNAQFWRSQVIYRAHGEFEGNSWRRQKSSF